MEKTKFDSRMKEIKSNVTFNISDLIEGWDTQIDIWGQEFREGEIGDESVYTGTQAFEALRAELRQYKGPHADEYFDALLKYNDDTEFYDLVNGLEHDIDNINGNEEDSRFEHSDNYYSLKFSFDEEVLPAFDWESLANHLTFIKNVIEDNSEYDSERGELAYQVFESYLASNDIDSDSVGNAEVYRTVRGHMLNDIMNQAGNLTTRDLKNMVNEIISVGYRAETIKNRNFPF